MKSFKLTKFLLGILLAMGLTPFQLINSQSNPEKREVILPVIKYDPFNFESMVRKRLHYPLQTDYLRIKKSKDANDYFMVAGGEEFRFSQALYPVMDIPSDTDSLFVFYFIEYPFLLHDKGRLPIEYFGNIENGNITFFENKNNGKKGLSLLDVINSKFGSVDKMKELLVISLTSTIDEYVMGNGIYPQEQEVAVSYLKNDYIFYWRCFPDDEETTLKLFFDFLKDNIKLQDSQEDLIRTRILAEKDQPEPSNIVYIEPYYSDNPLDKIKVFNRDISYILVESLEKDQYLKIIKENRTRYYLYNRYTSTLYTKRSRSEEGYNLIKSDYLKKVVFGKL